MQKGEKVRLTVEYMRMNGSFWELQKAIETSKNLRGVTYCFGDSPEDKPYGIEEIMNVGIRNAGVE